MRPIRLIVNVVQLDDHDCLSETGALQFDGDADGTAVDKVRDFLDKISPPTSATT